MNEKTAERCQTYFSPSGIRERYASHTQNESADSGDLLFDVARNTVELMRRDGKSNEEIYAGMKDTFHFSDEVASKLVKR